MESKKALATDAAEYGWPRGIKYVDLENRSTTMRITDLPPILGNPSTKSIAMSLHTELGTTKGWRSPIG
jgi:hypothetical protein